MKKSKIKSVLILSLFSMLFLTAKSQNNALPNDSSKEDLLRDSLKKVYKVYAVHLSPWGYYWKGDQKIKHDRSYKLLGRDFKISPDATRTFKEYKKYKLAGSVITAASLILMGVSYYQVTNATSTVNIDRSLRNFTIGALITIPGSICITISRYKLQRSIDFYNRDILLPNY
jgi:hypothetical protein